MQNFQRWYLTDVITVITKGSDKFPGGQFHCSIAETASEPSLFYLYFHPIYSLEVGMQRIVR
jgi:hypothetical protein